MMVKMQHSVQRGCQGYCLSLSGGFSASPVASVGFSACPAASRLRGFSACPAAPRLRGFSASRLVRWLLGFLASRLVPGFSASRLVGFSASRLVSYFAASRLLGLCRASRLLGFWSHFWAPFARALRFFKGPWTFQPPHCGTWRPRRPRLWVFRPFLVPPQEAAEVAGGELRQRHGKIFQLVKAMVKR